MVDLVICCLPFKWDRQIFVLKRKFNISWHLRFKTVFFSKQRIQFRWFIFDFIALDRYTTNNGSTPKKYIVNLDYLFFSFRLDVKWRINDIIYWPVVERNRRKTIVHILFELEEYKNQLRLHGHTTQTLTIWLLMRRKI